MPGSHSPSFDKQHIIDMFAQMSQTYGMVNLLSSFGITYFWRRACIRAAQLDKRHRILDVMSGMSEIGIQIHKSFIPHYPIDSIDFCPAMIEKAQASTKQLKTYKLNAVEADVFTYPYTHTYDRITCSFGLKTLNKLQQTEFATLVYDRLSAGGIFAAVEISLPKITWLRCVFTFYLKCIIPKIGKLCLGNPDNYCNLFKYTQDFEARDQFIEIMKDVGFEAKKQPLFWGCGNVYMGKKT